MSAPARAWRDEFGAVREVLERFRRADRSVASDDERLAWLDDVRDLGRRLAALSAVLISEADQAGSAMRARGTRLEDWLARNGQETPREVSGAVWAARALEQRPAVRDAAAAGRISLRQAAAIGEALNGLPTGLTAETRRDAEDVLLAEAAHTPAGRLRTMSEQVLQRVAPEAVPGPEEQEAALVARDQRAQARRRLWFSCESDGSLEFAGSLPIVVGRQFQNLVQTLADRTYRAAKDNRDRALLMETPQQRAADALVQVVAAAEIVELGESGSASSESGTAGAGRPVSVPPGAAQVQVLIPYGDLLDRATARGVLDDGTRIAAGELRVLLCDAGIVPVVLGGESQVLDVGREYRLAPPPLRRAIGIRDGGCAFPGCTTALRHCDIHHVVPWQEGGATSRDNTVALCRVHHALCEPRPPTWDSNVGEVPVDQWEVRIRDGLPEFLPPAALDPGRTPVRRPGRAATLFDSVPPRRAG